MYGSVGDKVHAMIWIRIRYRNGNHNPPPHRGASQSHGQTVGTDLNNSIIPNSVKGLASQCGNIGVFDSLFL